MNAIILFAHGSRDPLWRTPIEAVAQRIRALRPQRLVQCAYLELCEPDLPKVAIDLIAACAYSTALNGKNTLKIRIIPMFLGMGKHAREDLPRLVQKLRTDHPSVEFDIVPPIGEDVRVTALLAQLALAEE